MRDSWHNLVVTISNATPKGKVCFEDVSNSLLNEEMPKELTLGDRRRKPY